MARSAASLLALVGFAMHCAAGQASAPAPTTSNGGTRRIPRQALQVATGLQGIIRNSSGAGLPEAAIRLRRTGDDEPFPLITAGDGVFRKLDVPPGVYEISIERSGYASKTFPSVRIRAGEVAEFEVVLDEVPAASNFGRVVVEQSNPGQRPADGSGERQSEPRFPALTQGSASVASDLPDALDRMSEPVFTEIPDRWGEDYPAYRRYGKSGEYPVVPGHWYNPFDRNKFKGDYPIIGNRTFLTVSLVSDSFAEGRKLPTPSNVAAENPGSSQFFGNSGQFLTSENLSFSLDLFHGDAAFRPIDWRIRFTPELNVNYLLVQERGIVNPDPRAGTTRLDSHAGLQEAFVEAKLFDLSHDYDFVSARAGIQSFNSDFRGFIFFDQEPGVRIFGNWKSNRYQYNLAGFSMLEKDTNSGLNTFNYRGQQVYIANLYRQDFIKPGYTIQASLHYDKDDPSFQFDENHFLVRPAPVGRVKPHSLRAYYYGLTGDGHFGKLNITHAFYQVLGHDNFNTIARKKMDINAQMAAVELSMDKDWLRYRVSFFYASGDEDFNKKGASARGFDAIFDRPNFGGGIFSFWNREGIRLTGSGVALVNGDSLVPSLRSSKIQGQANFVNPGLYLFNTGIDADVNPKLRAFLNLNLIRFDHTAPLEAVLFQKPIHAGVGADSGLGVRYRPPLSENIILTAGFNAFFPFQGFRDIYTGRTLFAGFVNLRFRF